MDSALWSSLLRTAVVAVTAYLSLVLLLRFSGKRTLAKMNAFDFVVTVALGSTLATIVLSPTTRLPQGVLALAILIGLQYAISWLSVRIGWLRRAVKSEPTTLLRKGGFADAALERQRVAREEVRQAIRSSGYGGLSEIEAVVLETDGTFSVIPRSQAGSADALTDVRGHAAHD